MIHALYTLAATGSSEAAGTAAESEGIGALGLSLPSVAASALTFLVLFYVIKKYALQGIVENLKKREDDINRGLHLTAEMDKQKAEFDEKVEGLLQTARKDADGIIAEAQQESGKIIQTAEESAGRKAEEIIRAAEGKIEREISEARSGLKAEMADLIVDATETILQEKIDAKSDRKLVENYIAKVLK